MLKETLQQDMKSAMKSGDVLSRDVLRMVLTAIGLEEIEKKTQADGLSDEDVISVIVKNIKQRNESVSQYTQAGRLELAQKEKEEIVVLQRYLPEQLSPEEIDELVEKTIREIGATSMQDIGRVMGGVMAQVKGKADGNVIRARVESRLGEK